MFQSMKDGYSHTSPFKLHLMCKKPGLNQTHRHTPTPPPQAALSLFMIMWLVMDGAEDRGEA